MACSQSHPQRAETAGALPSPASPSPAATPAGCAAAVLARLDEPQRVGQLLWVGLGQNRLGPDEVAAIRDRHAGAVWFTELSGAPVAEVKQVAASVQALAGQAAGGVGLLVAANQEGGQIDQLHGPGFSRIPSAAEQGRLEPAELRQDAARWGRELLAAGVNLEVAPVVDTLPPGSDDRNQPIGVLGRAFGHDPVEVSAHGIAFVQGMHDAGLPATLKHFPGLGRVEGNTDFAVDVVDRETGPGDPYLRPFADGVAAGADVVMVSTVTYTRIDPERLAAFSPRVIRELLRGELGFQGVVAADDLGAAAAVAAVPVADRALRFVEAGGDLVDIKYARLAAPMADALLGRAQADTAFRARVDEAALHVLRLKERYGLLPRC